ncbi:MAG: zinc ribbon domain-containing protein [Clostridia bacterium]|nr:zinc ribbon domain-containing protein [Clostridia bacterium]
MFCKNCGKQIPDDSTFCPGCGASVTSVPTPVYDYPHTPAPATLPGENEAAKSILTFGILSLAFACTWVLSFLGIVFAAIGLSKVRNYVSTYGPVHHKAKVGRILSKVGLPVSIALTVLFILYVVLIVVLVILGINGQLPHGRFNIHIR